MVTLEILYSLTPTDFTDIVDTAMMACGYWIDEASFYEPYDDGDPEAKLTLRCEGQIYEVTQSKLEEAISKVFHNEIKVSQATRGDIVSAVKEDDYGYIDSDAADVLLQTACFGEIVYG